MSVTTSLAGLFVSSKLRSRAPRHDRRRKPTLSPHCELLEVKIAPATFTWTGAGGDPNWSNTGNWGGSFLTPGNDLVFPSVANESSNCDMVFPQSSITISAPGYTMTGNFPVLLFQGITTTYTSGTSNINFPVGISGPISVGAGGTLNIGGGGVDSASQLTKSGSGTLVLSATNTFSGPTTVNSGTLDLEGSLPYNTTVNPAGTLDGSGMVNGSLTDTGGLVAPGTTSTGTLTALFSSFDSASTLAIRLGGTGPGTGYDQLVNTAGSLSLDNTNLNVSLVDGFTPTAGEQFVIVNNAGTTFAVTGTFDGLPEGASLSIGGFPFKISYLGTNGSDNDVVLTAQGEATTTSLSSDVNPSVFGQSVTFTASVSADSEASGTPTGTVDFYDGATDLGTVAVNPSGVATLSLSTLDVADSPHSITAVYSGDSNYGGSTSTVDSQTVTQASSTTVLTSAPDPSVFGQSKTLTATVTAVAPGSDTPTGSVEFFDGTTDLGPGTLSDGVATFTTSSLTVGAHSLTAVYGGDTNFTGGTSLVDTQAVNQAASTATLTSAPNPSVFGQSVTFTATVAAAEPGSGTPTGTVQFEEGSTVLGTGTLDGSGEATFSTSTLSVASHSITAVYEGDTNFTGSTSQVLDQVVDQISTTTTLTSNLNPSLPGQNVTFTATVTKAPLPEIVMLAMPTANPDAPAAIVSFYDGTARIGAAVPNSQGIATFRTSVLAIGTHPIKAVYSGSPTIAGSTSLIVDQVVGKLTPIVDLASSANTWTFGQSATFTATVSSTGPLPTGTVTFLDDSIPLGTSSLSSGVATFTTSAIPGGTHDIVADYSGDVYTEAATSQTKVVTVSPVPTTTTLVVSPQIVVNGQMVSFTATVDPPAMIPTGGDVSFINDGRVIGQAPLVNGQAILNVKLTGTGVHDFTASYLGCTNFQCSSTAQATKVAVSTVDTQVTLAGQVVRSANGRILGIDLVTTVSANPPGGGVASGFVTYYVDGRAFRKVAVASGVSVTFVDLRYHMNKTFVVKYHGDASFVGATSNKLFTNRKFFQTARNAIKPKSKTR